MRKCTGNESGNHEHCEDIKDSNGDMVVVCHDCQTTLGKKCEVYSRVCGYMRPVSGWNPGKQSEHNLRTSFLMPMPR